MDEETADKLYARAWDRFERRAAGLGMPILWHLAMRGYEPAMVTLSDLIGQPGPVSRGSSSNGFLYRAYRKGYPIAAQNLAMNHFNRGNLGGYRRWLARAAKLGDDSAASELKRFELRLPHTAATRIHRKRPYHARDF